MPVLNPVKTVDKSKINCGDTANVTIKFTSSPPLKANPADIILIMDRSGSMDATRMKFAKEGAGKLIDMVVSASGGTDSVANDSRLALVSFATDAKVEEPLTSDAVLIKSKVDALVSGGFTNQSEAFTKAKELLDPNSKNKQIVVMFTDGLKNQGGDPNIVADEIKAMGAEIYCIGLATDPAPLEQWANSPSEIYVSSTNDILKLTQAFESIAYEVIEAGAHDVTLNEKLSPDFKIVKVNEPTVGTAVVRGTREIIWQADGVGKSENEEISLTFSILHTGKTDGTVKVNESLVYSDREGNTLVFPEPSVEVSCKAPVVVPESCPLPVAFVSEACRDMVSVEVPEAFLTSLGRIVRVNAVLKNICPNREVAAAIFLTEMDNSGTEKTRGMKTVIVPPQAGTECMDIALKCINFVVPERENDICRQRGFNVRVIANYTDSDFTCCDETTVIL